MSADLHENEAVLVVFEQGFDKSLADTFTGQLGDGWVSIRERQCIYYGMKQLYFAGTPAHYQCINYRCRKGFNVEFRDRS